MFFSIFWTTYIPIALVILSLAGNWLMGVVRRAREGARVTLSSWPRVRHKSSCRNGQIHEAAAIVMVRDPRLAHSRPRR
jgi:hypothetical protein